MTDDLNAFIREMSKDPEWRAEYKRRLAEIEDAERVAARMAQHIVIR